VVVIKPDVVTTQHVTAINNNIGIYFNNTLFYKMFTSIGDFFAYLMGSKSTEDLSNENNESTGDLTEPTGDDENIGLNIDESDNDDEIKIDDKIEDVADIVEDMEIENKIEDVAEIVEDMEIENKIEDVAEIVEDMEIENKMEDVEIVEKNE